jgi:hypothetical protein
MTAGPARNNREIESPLLVLPICCLPRLRCLPLDPAWVEQRGGSQPEASPLMI